MAWSRIRGHDPLVQLFQSAHGRGRLAHAYLFTGPPGVGKRLFANELAKALLCESLATPLAACDRCSGCKLTAAGTHPDFLVIRTPEDKLEFPIDTMREFLTAFGLKPSRGSRKVAFVEDAGDFNEESANAFLKTLEEPPPGSLLILRSASADVQLATIRSRCQPVPFSPLPDKNLSAVLAEKGIDAGKIDDLVKLSAGSVGRAVALADPALAEFRRAIIESLAAAKFNPAAFAERWIKFVEDAGKESPLQRARAALALHLLLDALRSTLRQSLGLPGDVRLQSLATRLGPDRLTAAIDSVLEADRHVDQRVALPITFELLADRLNAA